ncbi:MAG: hypothetical protein H7Z75_04890 [Ferruginibacter sp.]|nr:hypothetical protein [Cytophagales bacterium]
MPSLFHLEHEHKYRFLNHQYDVGPKFLVTLPDRIADGITFPDFPRTFTLESCQYILMFALVGIRTKSILHLIASVSPKNLCRANVTVEDQGHGTLKPTIREAATFSNYLGVKKHLDQLPTGKYLIIDLTNTHLVDHTFMENPYHFKHDYARRGGGMHTEGLENQRPVSDHPRAARKAAREKVKQ